MISTPQRLGRIDNTCEATGRVYLPSRSFSLIRLSTKTSSWPYSYWGRNVDTENAERCRAGTCLTGPELLGLSLAALGSWCPPFLMLKTVCGL